MAKLKRFLRKASFLLATSPSSSFPWPRAFSPPPSHGGLLPARTTRYFSPASKIYMKATSSSRTPSNLLAQVRRHSQVILDTADYLQLAHLPGTLEVTTNPSIVWQAAQKEEYFHLLEEACNMYLPLGIDGIPDMVEAVPPKFAREIWKRLPRAPSSSSLPLPRVYVQLDPRYAFDIDLAVRQSLALVDLCVHKHQLPLPNLVIKIPGSWEGIQAAKVLERGEGEGGKEGGVRCLVTGVTSIVQAYAAAEAGVSYVAPYVGRVSDWEGREEDKEEGGAEERGVTLARDIQVLFKMRRWAGTLVMAASLRGIEQVKQLSGCDILTVSPQVMIALECAEPVLEEEEGGGEGLASFLPPVPSLRDLSLKSRRLLGMEGKGGKGREEGGEGGAPMTEAEFRTALAEDACGTAVFAKSMKTFIQDLRALERVFFDYLRERPGA